MARLPVVSGRKVITVLVEQGFEEVGRKGSHIRLKRKSEPVRIVVVPDHKELTPGTLLSIIRRSGLSKDEFISLLDR